ncbi:hypothetical protein AHAS_Ahas14G0182500 [Arachis hypogaea]
MTTSPLLLLFIIFILFLISSRRCPPWKAHPPLRLSLLPMGCCSGKWSPSNLFSIRRRRWWWRRSCSCGGKGEEKGGGGSSGQGHTSMSLLLGSGNANRVMCEAAKKSLKEKKLHIGPWKKSGFMQLKWSGFNQTLTLANSMGDIPANEPYLRISGAPTVLVT